MSASRSLLLPSGGYHRLKSFQLARLVYDITVRFVELYIPANSRTCDQMVQAARSGVQNIAEGSIDAATSRKIELNLYNVARGSLEELRLDYEDYLRQHQVKMWGKEDGLYAEFVARRIATSGEFKAFIKWAESVASSEASLMNIPYKSALVANATLLLIEAATYLLQRQIKSKVLRLQKEGKFSTRMYHSRRRKM